MEILLFLGTQGKALCEIPGEGMRGYYDRILPAVANRWARPLGAPVTTAQIRPRFRQPTIRYRGG